MPGGRFDEWPQKAQSFSKTELVLFIAAVDNHFAGQQVEQDIDVYPLPRSQRIT